MGMVFCQGCGKQLHNTAPTCPHCGAPQHSSSPSAQQAARTSWMSICSLILGIIATLAMFDESEWDMNTYVGVGLFAVGGMVFGIIDLSDNTPNRGLSIAGLVLSTITLLALIGLAFG